MNQGRSNEFNFDTALVLLESSDRFPVDFDASWQWLGYSSKQKAKDKLINNFEMGLDYALNHLVESDNHAGLSAQERAVASKKEIIKLTTDCFKSFCMMAGTEKGKQVRRYFLMCERELKQRTSDSFLIDLLEYRLTAKFELRFVAIEERLDRLETQINSRGKSKLAALPTDKKYLYTSTRRISQCQLILNFLEQQRGEKFGADGLAQRLNIPSSSTRRILLSAYRRGLIDREINPKCSHQKKGVSEYFYFVL